ncbi:MAG: hypothetical protein ACRDMH_13435 [Solirubrobacterales bacterium]
MAYAVPFAITFRAEMNGAEVARLSSELGMTFHGHPKLDLPFFAFGRLDFDSGLYLLRDQGDRWRLECRTYGRPSETAIEGWELHATWVVDLIDPGIKPARETAPP